jgi:uncharacterized protein YegL
MRRLPVYLLLDCSESMIGEAMQGLQTGLEMMLRSLRSDPHALDVVWLSCITFDREARVAFPLTELTDVQPPVLKVRPGTALGAALNLCADRIEAEVLKTTHQQKGDWRPLIILLTDGQPTDNWDSALRRLGNEVVPKPAKIYAIGCGDDVDCYGLQALTDTVLQMREMTEERFKRLFTWLTASVTEGSRSLQVDGAAGGFDLQALPQEVVRVEHRYSQVRPGRQSQVLLFARCCKTPGAYLTRFRWNEETLKYVPVSVYPIEWEAADARSGFELPKVNSEEIVDVLPCPHCENPGILQCDCGLIMCFADVAAKCPNCAAVIDAFEGGKLELGQSLG